MSMTPLERYRKGRGLSQAALARAAATDQGTISRIESREQVASPQLAEKIALATGHAVTEMQVLYPDRYTATPVEQVA